MGDGPECNVADTDTPVIFSLTYISSKLSIPESAGFDMSLDDLLEYVDYTASLEKKAMKNDGHTESGEVQFDG